MNTIAALAAEFDMQPCDVAAALDLDVDYADHAELDDATAVEYREVLTVLAEVAM